jgi:galactokinase/mevalonate kinase-like predicted kinase
MKLIHYHQGGGCDCARLHVPPEIIRELERDSLLIYTGEVHLSGTIHADIKRSYALENSPTIRAMDHLKAAALKMAAALEAGDLETYDACLNASRLNHYGLHASCDSDTLRRFFAGLWPYIRSGKACGAGGGGFIFVHVKPGHQEECVAVVKALGGKVYPFKLDEQGVVTREEPPTTADEIARLRAGL